MGVATPASCVCVLITASCTKATVSWLLVTVARSAYFFSRLRRLLGVHPVHSLLRESRREKCANSASRGSPDRLSIAE